jgi:hypothetical protein
LPKNEIIIVNNILMFGSSIAIDVFRFSISAMVSPISNPSIQ